MNREQVEKILPILQAFAEGKPIQYHMWSGKWDDATSINVKFLKENPERFRIKPKPRRFTVMVPKPEHPSPARMPELDKGVWYNPNLWERVEVVEVLNG